jgi:protein O-GlcNAc transferase
MDTSAGLSTSLKLAIAHHQAGRVQEAVEGYKAVLHVAPQHPAANYNMGLLALQNGEAAAGLPYLLAALEAEADRGQYWISYIDALFQAGQRDEALQVLKLAREQGLQGEEVEALAQRLGAEPREAADDAVKQRGARPGHAQIDALVSEFGAGRYAEAAVTAQRMTEQYPQHEFGWKALGAAYKQLGRTEDALAAMQQAAALSPGDVEAHYNLGVTQQALDRLDEAENSYREAIRLSPDYADAHSNLGVVLQTLGRLDEAAVSYRQALQIWPDYVEALGNLGKLLHALGQLEDAIVCFRALLKIRPADQEAHYNLGVLLGESGQAEAAVSCFRRALHIAPDYADAHFSLGNTLKEMACFAEAKAAYQMALKIMPDNAQVHYNLGNLLKDAGRTEEAEASYQQALQIEPDFARAQYNLGNIQLDGGRLAEAVASYRQAIQSEADLVDAHYNLANALKEMGSLTEAEAAYRHALHLDPEYAEAHSNLGNALKDSGRLSDAEACYRRAIHIKPTLLEAHCNLGNVLMASGRYEPACASYQHALQIDAEFVDAHSNLIFTRDLMPGMDTAALQAERRRWAAAHAAHLDPHRAHTHVRDPARRLRIGYVSADFRVHSAAYVFGAMLVHYDRDAFEVTAYANSTIEDELTREFKQHVTHWRRIAGMSDEAVAELIRADGIDILVDLSGHSSGNRLRVFARKPAPVQITAWGYAAGTGMPAMDVLFSDPVFIPPKERPLYAEQVRYLPCAISYFHHHEAPPVNALPALSGSGITFGSFNRLVKNSQQTYRVWARVLQACPGSRMLIKTPALEDAGTCAQVKACFAAEGIAPERILLQGRSTRDAHMAAFNQIDMALDPFPHGGGVTALEGLMMGVPLVTLRWPTLTGRVSASIMTTLGLTDWIAETPEQYVELAVKKAADVPGLSSLRGRLRGIFAASVLGDQLAYTRAAEQQYRLLWRDWCAS